jgi:hypothetical protein
MNNFKLGRGYIDNNIRRRYTINLRELTPNETINRISEMLRDNVDIELDINYGREVNPNENNTI